MQNTGCAAGGFNHFSVTAAEDLSKGDWERSICLRKAVDAEPETAAKAAKNGGDEPSSSLESNC